MFSLGFYVSLIILALRGMLVLPSALKLHIAHNKVTRFINSLGRRLKVTAKTLGELNSFTFETRVKQLRLNHVHKLFYELCLSYLKKTLLV